MHMNDITEYDKQPAELFGDETPGFSVFNWQTIDSDPDLRGLEIYPQVGLYNSKNQSLDTIDLFSPRKVNPSYFTKLEGLLVPAGETRINVKWDVQW